MKTNTRHPLFQTQRAARRAGMASVLVITILALVALLLMSTGRMVRQMKVEVDLTERLQLRRLNASENAPGEGTSSPAPDPALGLREFQPISAADPALGPALDPALRPVPQFRSSWAAPPSDEVWDEVQDEEIRHPNSEARSSPEARSPNLDGGISALGDPGPEACPPKPET